jgi:hypothetical protein
MIPPRYRKPAAQEPAVAEHPQAGSEAVNDGILTFQKETVTSLSASGRLLTSAIPTVDLDKANEFDFDAYRAVPIQEFAEQVFGRAKMI